DSLDAWLQRIEAYGQYIMFTRESQIRARELYQAAHEADPNWAFPVAGIAFTHWYEARRGWSDSRDESIRLGIEFAERAIELQPKEPIGYMALGNLMFLIDEPEKGIELRRKAVELAPNSFAAVGGFAIRLSELDKEQEAVELFERAIRLSPKHPWWVEFGYGLALHLVGRKQEAVETYKKGINTGTGAKNAPLQARLAAVYADLGRMDEAEASIADALQVNPKFTVAKYQKSYPFPNAERNEWYKNLLVQSGLPEHPPLALPDKPSIAILPFTNMSDDPTQEYFVDGMTEDLITDLSKLSGLFVIARNSVFTYKGKPVKVKEVAQELGVKYVLEGSVRRAGGQVRINTQLIDATTGGHLWAERYDGTLADVFDLQDKVTKRIVDALTLELTPEEAQRVGSPGTDNVEAHDAYLLGLSFYYRRTPEGFVKAKSHFERAIELDPNYAAAHAAIAKIFAQVGRVHTYTSALSVNKQDITTKARTALVKAQAQPLADVYVVRSWLALNKHQQKQAIAEAKRALELNANEVDALEALALSQIYAGQPESGIELVKRAMRQNPTLLARPFLLMGLAEFALGNTDRAVDHIKRAFELGSEEILFAGILAAAYAELGIIDQAEAAFEVFRQIYIRPDLSRMMINFPFANSDVLQRLAKGLALSGAKVWYSAEDGGYVPLNEANKLSGAEIESLLSGKRIDGKSFWQATPWGREQSIDGAVKYTGYWIQGSEPKKESGMSRIEGNLLCDRWEAPDPLELCSVIFRMPEGNARKRWSDYVMV
ncbi:MAG: hypothetical protein OEU36_25570, partial [Gammaproteobacteria bacterium]|nr:hypothetical protein [Gammaproteobacteria bacterium]